MKMKIYKVIKVIIFFSILTFLISGVSYICLSDNLEKEQIVLYDQEEQNSIDIAFVGNSSTYRYYNVMSIWNDYNLTSMCYFSAGVTFDYTISLMELAQDKQTPELIVVDLRSLVKEEYRVKYFGMKEIDANISTSLETLSLFTNVFDKWEMLKVNDLLSDAKYMYLFNVLYYHENFADGWELFGENQYQLVARDFKGNYMNYNVVDLSDSVDGSIETVVDENYELTDEITEEIMTVLQYCEDNDLNVLFTFTPYIGEKNSADANIRIAVGEMLVDCGFSFIDFQELSEEIGMDYATDFYDESHVNILGANKYTTYFMEYIMEQYTIEPDYSETVIQDWDEIYSQWENYNEKKLLTLYEEIEELQSLSDEEE